MSTNQDKFDALRKQAVKDKPPVKKKSSGGRRKSGAIGKAGRTLDGPRARTSVNLTPEALEALKQVQAFLITECGASTAAMSAAMCVAIELTAEELKGRKQKIKDLYESQQAADRRRSAV